MDRQLLRAFHTIAAAFELEPNIDLAEAAEREHDLAQLSFRLVQASITTPARSANVAVDATLKWGWDRPTGLHRKLDRRGVDGDAGPAIPLSDIIDQSGDVFTRSPLDDLRYQPVPRRTKPKTWTRGSAWVGRPTACKSVYGVALHAVTATDPDCPPPTREKSRIRTGSGTFDNS